MHIDRYLKNGVSKSIVHKYVNFQLYRVHPGGAIGDLDLNLTIGDKFINKRVRRFIHQTIC